MVAQLALQSSSAARLQRQTHLNTLNMSSMEEEASTQGTQEQHRAALPLSQLAFKVRGRQSMGGWLLVVEIVLLFCASVVLLMMLLLCKPS